MVSGPRPVVLPIARARLAELEEFPGPVCVHGSLIRLGDWVRERPADHIQPCACCLCRPAGRPAMRVTGIGRRAGETWLVLGGGYECPAPEVEPAPPPYVDEPNAAGLLS